MTVFNATRLRVFVGGACLVAFMLATTGHPWHGLLTGLGLVNVSVWGHYKWPEHDVA